MPFDGVGSAGNLALQKLDLVMELLATEAQWCKRRFTTADGRHCLKGAIHLVEAGQVLEPIVLDAIRHVTGRSFRRIESFNDNRLTTHALVLRVLYQTRERILFGQFAPEEPRSHAASWLRSTVTWLAHAGRRGVNASTVSR